ncbi:hypothetical protein NG697_00755 [Pseudarthrobacter sp. MDT3-26]|uniref:hypothetical protein n=1 Tax=Pseudarthrobacter raffinosi TaxID=2953651 RepID=UPI00208FC0EA|nr:hypothetical protein [Pseudarthrobacter sp. MDT3-26]MCO4261482.1 hypothetical protein [Pseudarthrobacter sp. MDT3-26]
MASDAVGNAVWSHVRTTASNTIGLAHLVELLDSAPKDASLSDYTELVVDENLLGRETGAGRQRTLRQLREVFTLDPDYPPFRALRDLWGEDKQGQPLMAGLLAFTRDEFLRDSFSAVRGRHIGETVSSTDLARAVGDAHPNTLSVSTLSKVGRNTASSWRQIGHLSGRALKVRARVQARPSTAAYALYLGHLSGLRGSLLMDSPWTELLDTTPDHVRLLAAEASTLGYLEFRSSGGVDDIGFSHLSRNEPELGK